MPYVTNPYVVAAICGNFYQESTVNPGIWENLTPNSPGYGLGQWTDNAQVSRRTALFNWLNNHGYNQDSGEGQLYFFIDENVWNVYGANHQYSIYNSLTEYLHSNSTDLNFLTDEFMYHWEGINDGTNQTRRNFANDVLTAILNDDGTRFAWISGNFYNTHASTLKNSMLIYDFLMGSIPQPPTPVQPSDEEIISIIRKFLKENKGRGVHIII